ncbi:hypothetical protein [Pseudoalteromonas sp. 1_2015MBL_MicDiv]|uniref:hypothetical protein n=1 Tax=Pseudoalteromonas sp. 1_2015MBL_MicDiv TaxID=1720343 RepID=UPI000BBE2444|nr:hypothetical protein [Pseudoalteromonas sp. 1_2015MBL_MicDiv]ATG76504.1 hypothetical protein AOR04_02525 [Pseudoalteromonas sp. 1_2015MBL_MicDiv]
MDSTFFQCYKSFVLLFVVIYLPGLLFYPFFSEGFSSYFNYTEGVYLNSFILIFSFLFLTFISFYLVSKIPYTKVYYINSKLCLLIVFSVVLVYFLLSVNFSLNFTSSFRHKNRLSNAGGLVAVLFFLKPIIYFIVSLMLINILNGRGFGRKGKILLFLILISSILSLNSSLQFIIVPIIFIMIVSPGLMTKNFYDFNIKYLLTTILFIPLICIVVVFIGIGNKVGYDYLLSSEGLNYILNYGNTLFPRMSTSLFSSVILLNNTLNGVFYSSEVLDGIHATLLNRFSLILPIDNFDSSLINTVNRLNYLEVFRNHADRAGASPGIISSIFYTPFFPATFFIIPLYIACIFRALRVHMKNIRFNFLSVIIFPYLILNLFESPLNILYIADPVFILFFTVVFLGRFINVEEVFSK